MASSSGGDGQDLASGKRCLEVADDGVQGRKKVQLEKCKVVLRFAAGQGLLGVSPVAFSKGLKRAVGDVEVAKVLWDGNLLLVCRNAEQRDKALGLQTVFSKVVVDRKIVGEVRGSRGVISGIPVSEDLEALKKVIKGGEVETLKRLPAYRDGEKVDSTSVLLCFRDRVLPVKVMIGYLCFSVKAYVPPPLRCFKCQRFGHIAAVCRSKRRCSKCGGDHDYDDCGVSQLSCCNCGGSHSAAFAGCVERKAAAEIQKVKSDRNLSYAEAVRVVKRDVSLPSVVDKPSVPDCGQGNITVERLIPFVAYVINCSEQATTKTENIKIIVQAAARFFGVKELSWERVRDELSRGEGAPGSEVSPMSSV